MASDALLRELVRQYDDEGLTNQKIAAELGIGVRGVQRIRFAYKKIDAGLRAAGQLPEEPEEKPVDEDPLSRPLARQRAPYPSIPGHLADRRVTIFAR